jgi:A/G-specific adenine glycosylase
MEEEKFIDKIWEFHRKHRRSFVWRENISPYWVVVSEIMLQQTQTSRVSVKFSDFIGYFPDFSSLANAELSEVLAMWQGLGYNRRGKFLHEIAKKVVLDFDNTLPSDPQILNTFPGIGSNTAGSIVAFAYNIPTIFIETNIRRVFIHEFFGGQENIHDKQILPLIAQTLDKENPREWYYALMDYGSWLKTQVPNPNRKSSHYKVQTKFEGSNRQVRSTLLRYLLQHKSADLDVLQNIFSPKETRVQQNLLDLAHEGFIEFDGLKAQIR